MCMIKKNASVSALAKHMAKEKKHNSQTLLEYNMAFQTNAERGHVFNQEELIFLYDREGQAQGASKAVHTIAHNGFNFEYIIVKRMLKYPYIPDDAGSSGNQLHDEVEFWKKFSHTEYGDLLCPTLRAYETKSDHNEPRSKTALKNIVVISQRAVYISNMRRCCEEAERLNAMYGYAGEDFTTRKNKLVAFANKMKWRDVEYNGGNSGVIFDYSQNCFKAVFVDYAL